MIAMWMLRLLLATTLIALAARLAEEAARGLGWPRRWVWTGAFVLAPLLPWLGGLMPSSSPADALLVRFTPAVVGAEAPAERAEPTAVGTAGRSGTERGLTDVVLIAGWALGSSGLVFVFGRALWRVRVTRRRAGTATVRAGGVQVIRSDSLGPAAVGIVRPAIVLPRWVDDLPESEQALIVSHEREHATARDPLLVAAAALVVAAAPWCLPLWWMHRRLRDAAETDCDTRVVARGVDRIAYGCALLRAAGQPRPAAAAFAALLFGGFDVTRLERRILMMTQQRPRYPLLRGVPLLAAAALAVIVACDAASDAVSAPPEGEDDAMIPRTERERVVAANVLSKLSTGSCRGPGPDGSSVRRPSHWFVSPTGCGVGPAAADSLYILGNPLIYVDGELVDDGASAELLQPGWWRGQPQTRSLAPSEVDPATIDSIQVVKGETAALYDPDHAAGVILINTKNR